MRPRRRAADDSALGNIAPHLAAAGDLGPRTDGEVTGETTLSADLNVVADRRRSGESGECRDGEMRTDAAVVSDLAEVVDLRSVADRRHAGLRAIDARVRADLDVVAEFDVA